MVAICEKEAIIIDNGKDSVRKEIWELSMFKKNPKYIKCLKDVRQVVDGIMSNRQF